MNFSFDCKPLQTSPSVFRPSDCTLCRVSQIRPHHRPFSPPPTPLIRFRSFPVAAAPPSPSNCESKTRHFLIFVWCCVALRFHVYLKLRRVQIRISIMNRLSLIAIWLNAFFVGFDGRLTVEMQDEMMKLKMISFFGITCVLINILRISFWQLITK